MLSSLKYKFAALLIFIVFFLVLPHLANKVFAANLKFDSTEFSTKAGETFDVEVIVEPGSDAISSIDAYVDFDKALLQAQSATEGTYFPKDNFAQVLSEDQVYVAGYVNLGDAGKTESGTAATITFKALKNGTATLSFLCDTSQSQTSKIIKDINEDPNSTNIITCEENGSAEVTIAEGTNTTGGTTDTTTPSTLPESGILDNLIKFAVPGAALVLIGTLLKLLL